MDDFLEYLENKLEGFDYKRLIFPTILLLLYIAGFTYLFTIINKKEPKEVKEISNNYEIKTEEDIYIDIKGSVLNPGVYKLKSNSRVVDAIEKSGGLAKDANTRFLNLSKKLNDGDVIVVYSNSEIKNAQKQEIIYVETPCVCEEVKNDACYKEENTQSKSSKININTATIEDFKTLNGIGDAKAKAIIEYRTKNVNFKSIDELLNVNGISENVFSKIKENITI